MNFTSIGKNFPGGSDGKVIHLQFRRPEFNLGQENPLQKGVAPHSSIIAWRIPWTEEPEGLQSMGSQSQTQLSNLAQINPTLSLEFKEYI